MTARGTRGLHPLILFAALAFCAGTAVGQGQSGPGPDDFVYVCKDAGAGGCEAFPDVCRLRDGRRMAVFYAGYGHVSLPNEQHPRGAPEIQVGQADGKWRITGPIEGQMGSPDWSLWLWMRLMSWTRFRTSVFW